MTARYLLDTSAVLVHYLDEPGADRVTALFSDRSNELLLASPSVAELGRKLAAHGFSPESLRDQLSTYLALFEPVVPIDEAVAWSALELAAATPTRLPLVDSLIAAAARERHACLIHRNRHMAEIPSEVLPQIDLARPDGTGPVANGG